MIEEIEELHHIIELGPNWNTLERIVITLNRPAPEYRETLAVLDRDALI